MPCGDWAPAPLVLLLFIWKAPLVLTRAHRDANTLAPDWRHLSFRHPHSARRPGHASVLATEQDLPLRVRMCLPCCILLDLALGKTPFPKALWRCSAGRLSSQGPVDRILPADVFWLAGTSSGLDWIGSPETMGLAFVNCRKGQRRRVENVQKLD